MLAPACAPGPYSNGEPDCSGRRPGISLRPVIAGYYEAEADYNTELKTSRKFFGDGTHDTPPWLDGRRLAGSVLLSAHGQELIALGDRGLELGAASWYVAAWTSMALVSLVRMTPTSCTSSLCIPALPG